MVRSKFSLVTQFLGDQNYLFQIFHKLSHQWVRYLILYINLTILRKFCSTFPHIKLYFVLSFLDFWGSFFFNIRHFKIERSDYEPNSPWPAEAGGRETLKSVSASSCSFKRWQVSICVNREHLYRQNGMYNSLSLLHDPLSARSHYFYIFSSDGGKEFEDASAYQLPNAVHIARWPQFYRNIFSFWQAYEHYFRRLWWI